MFKAVVCSGAIVLGFTGTVPDTEARARRMICEEWRDYYYSVETGEFLGWAGDPYLECWYLDEPVSRPTGNPPHPDYNGGWGIPRDPGKPTCRECVRKQETCEEGAIDGGNACRRHHRRWARSWCERQKTDIDNRLIDDFTCTSVDGPRGKPRQVCHGNGIDRCVESFSLDISKWFTVGGNEGSSITWGGKRGFRDACRDAEQVAFLECQRQLDACKAEAGGCR